LDSNISQSDMTFEEFLQVIYARHSTNVKLGLDRMYALLKQMGYPNEKLKGIHVAGTNGKGSVCATLESLLLSHGHTTGLNTSPHLIDYTERFRVNGANITPVELMDFYHKYEDIFQETQASFFEITTALAFAIFIDKNVHTSIFEVGLGGRLDGTNPFHSTVTVISSISLDHPKSLGDTLPQIAFEKAGIIKEGVPVVIGNMPDIAREEILSQAKKKNATTYVIGKDFTIANTTLSPDSTRFDYSFPAHQITLENLQINLLGSHQANNVAVALTAFFLYLSAIKEPFDATKLRDSLQRINWMGRLQVLSQNPLVVIDGAHNEEGVCSLVQNLHQIFPDRKYHFVVAILRDKRLDKMIQEICTIAEVIYISKNSSDRAADIQEQVDVAIKCGTRYVADTDIVTAARHCLSEMNPTTDMMIVTGSLYTIAELLKTKIV